MKTLQHTLLKSLSLTVCAATLFISCSRDGDATQDGGGRELAVNVQMQNSGWHTRSDGGSMAYGTHDRTQVLGSVALDEQLEIVTECEPIGYTPEAPLTRGTPIGSASELQSLGFAVYTNSTFSKNCTATYARGSWSIANNIALDLDKSKYSYYAYAPAAAAADNGIKLNEADGKKLTYTAPADITKQPDLCRATPILDDQTGTATFAMQHALTAVGIKVRADNVEIQSIKLLGVNTSGTLDLTTGAWTGLGAVKDLEFTLSNNKPATGNGVVGITPNDGYLMLPPQAMTGDGKKLEIVYKYTSGSDIAEHTGIHLLSDITGGAWTAGQKVHYVIQLKAKFALDLGKYSATVPYSGGSYTLGYTTGSSASTTIDPQVTCPEASGGWISNLKVNQSNGSGTITFNYATNSSETVDRKVTITVTSGFTTKDFVLTQTKVPGVLIAGTVWTDTNLTGNASTNGGHRLEANPQDKGMFFKWGATFVYGRANSSSEGEGFASGQYTRGAATNPDRSKTSDMGYDYDYISGGSSYVGDPCKKLGASYRTPTRAQWTALCGSGYKGATYQGVQGTFFGPSASSCNNTTIQPGCIFLPASGTRKYDNGTLKYEGTDGYYWSSSVAGGTDYGQNCTFIGNYASPNKFDVRGQCLSVRCVHE